MNIINEYKHDLLNHDLWNLNTKIHISFEFFPPKNYDMENKFWNSIGKLSTLKPDFFSITYGANNSQCNQIFDLVSKVNQITKVEVAPHLTCINHTINELEDIAVKYWDAGIKHIIALRGDAQNVDNKIKMYGSDLVRLLKNIADFDISVAAYPEIHPEAINAKMDLLYLKKKIDEGANRAITQFFFNIDKFLRFRDKCISNNINVDIVPGILPISNFNQICRFSKMTNVDIPKSIYNIFNGLEKDQTTSMILGSKIAMDMVQSLYSEGINNFHFYTLNCSNISYAICCLLGIKPC
ncbi:5,10-methylenetetrahydrofolate reductase [Buchnera aphidicola (Eriosoma grossulariae)]|uniref:methylenetetrahydrofolate reductase n=1 Tax=Buchnera aphidicola TaxID=9 RepID=UPI0034640FBF